MTSSLKLWQLFSLENKSQEKQASSAKCFNVTQMLEHVLNYQYKNVIIEKINFKYLNVLTLYPLPIKHDTLKQCWFNVGPPSQWATVCDAGPTLNQHCFNVSCLPGEAVCEYRLTYYPAMLLYLIFQSLEVVSRYRDPQLQVSENYSYLSDY